MLAVTERDFTLKSECNMSEIKDDFDKITLRAFYMDCGIITLRW